MDHLVCTLTAHRDLCKAADLAQASCDAARRRRDLVDRATQLGLATQTENRQADQAYRAAYEAHSHALDATNRTGKAVLEAITLHLREGLEQRGDGALVEVLKAVLDD